MTSLALSARSGFARIGFALAGFVLVSALGVAAPPAEGEEAFNAAGEQRRGEIPLGGDFQPNPQVPTFVAVGHGARILVSKDDGATWTQAFFGYPGSDHGGWATNAVAYTNGVFALPVGWTKPTSYLASEDGVRWRHLTDGTTSIERRSDDPTLMPTAMSIAGGQGVFVFTGYMTIARTPDFGGAWETFALRDLKESQLPRKLVTHHIKTTWLGEESGRFLAIGNDRSKEDPQFGNLFASDDLGKTWTWLKPEGLDELKDYAGIVSNGKSVLLTDKAGENAYVSTDGGATWDGPHATGAGRRPTASVVGGEFWLSGKPSRASADGKTWRDLPGEVPSGHIAEAASGTLICVDRGRTNILRSADGGRTWDEVHSYEPPATEHIHGSQGLRDVVFGFTAPTN